jgi:hypothetical protein
MVAWVGDVELEDFERGILRGGPSAHLLGGFGVLAVDAPHRREYLVAAAGQGLGGAPPESAAGAGHKDGQGCSHWCSPP